MTFKIGQRVRTNRHHPRLNYLWDEESYKKNPLYFFVQKGAVGKVLHANAVNSRWGTVEIVFKTAFGGELKFRWPPECLVGVDCKCREKP